MKNKLSLCTFASLLWLTTSASAQVDLIAPGATWKYLDTGVDQGVTWKNTGFDDNAWKTGVSELGYGDGDEATVIGFGGDPNNRYPTYYFRHTFSVPNPGIYRTIAMTLTHDDGAVVYLNGTEVYRVNMGAGPVTYSSLAIDASDFLPAVVSLPASAFVAGANTIAVEVHQAGVTSPDLSFNLVLTGTIDSEAPTLITPDPGAGSVVTELAFIGVLFSENVTGVNASDLLINNIPATGMTMISPREYQFTFATPAAGTVQVAFAAGHGIADEAPTPNAFAGASWTYTYDPNLTVARPVISEFLADNETGIEDEDGTRSDWIEIFNPGPGDANLAGWGLSDTATNLMKWRFPAVNLAANRYLLVFASEKNKTNALAPLHTNFRLGKNAGGYLALSDSFGNPVSVFSSYPAQVADKSYGRDRVDRELVGYFDSPTPGVQNTVAGSGYAAEPVFNYESGVYTNASLLLTITAPPGATIRYTINGSEPTNATSGLAYTGPITISANTPIKARVFQTGLWPSPIGARNFILLDSSTKDFTSNLPLVIISTPGAIPSSVPATGTRVRGTVAIIDTFRGRAALTGKPDYIGMGQFETFGQTSEGFAKKPHNIELNDAYGNDRKVSVLGMPAEADWKMRNPYSDKCLMNDFLGYELFEQMGNYQCRRRFVEVFLNPVPNTKLTYANYYGVLVFLEKIEVGKDRVNIAELTSSQTNEPAISGGYMFKRDKDSTGDLNFTTTNGTAFKMHEPKPKDLSGGVANPQVQWLRRYLSLYEAAVGAADWLTRTGTNHYSNFIDIDTFVDSHWITEFTKQIDGYRISNFFSKDRNGKVKNVPIWDWNLSFGNANYLEGGKTNGWYYTQLGDGDHVFLRRLVGTSATTGDPEFKQKIVDRWSVLRTNLMSGERVLRRIDEIADQLSEAAVRNYVKYPILSPTVSTWPNPNGPAGGWNIDYVNPTNFSGIISEMKKWTWGRYLWVDSQFVSGPVFSRSAGPVPAGTVLAITASNPIYYTLDGTDPRLPGGNVAPGAQLYGGPITINANARVFARARSATAAWQGTTWSGPTIGTFVVATPKLIVSELMYNPAPDVAGSLLLSDDFEYLEVKNTGTSPLNLQRFRLSGGLDYEFPNVSLPAGQSGVIVANQAAFQARYGTGRLIIGQYTNRLANEGEHLVLEGPMKEPILDFNYKDGWYPLTDGLGFSLVVADENAPASAWDTKQGWRQSGALYGSPSANDPAPPTFPNVVVNEALTHTELPSVDTVELRNLDGTSASIANWFLSDDLKSPKKYQFPAGTTIPGNGLWTVSEAQFNVGPNSFSLSSMGDEIYLFSADAAGNLTGYYQGFDFGPQASGVTFGRYVVSTGEDQFVAQSSPSLEGQNSGPLVGPIVISEINYQPVSVYVNGGSWNNTEDEYIELQNISGNDIPLFDPNATTNTWRLRDAVDYKFPPGVTIPHGGYIIVAGVDANNPTELAAFRTRNNIPAGIPIFGPWEGNLDNSGDSIELTRPDSPNLVTVPYILADKVRYSNLPPWPTGAGIGASLQKVTASAFGNDPANWRITVASPGGSIPTGTTPVVSQQPQNTTVLETRSASFTVAATGTPPIAYQWYHIEGTNNVPVFGATAATLLLENVQTNNAGSYGCYVIGPGGVVSSATATLTVLIAPKIVEQPKTVDVRVRPDPKAPVSTNASFSLTATTANPPLSYQWRFRGEIIPGATANVLTLTGVTTNAYGDYSCDVTDGNGTVFSQSATLYPLVDPTTIVAPIGQTVPAGGLVGLSVQYGGFPAPFNVEWRVGSTPLTNYNTDATISQFVFRAVPTNFTLNYRAVIKNRANPAPGLATVQVPVTTITDTDHDGIPDSVETALGLNPNDPADANGDLDGDTMSNYAETIAGTNPQDPASYLKVTSTSAPSVFNVTFRAVAGHTYSVQYTDNLTAGSWLKLGDVAARATDRDETLTDTTANPNRLYRIVTPGLP